MEYLIETDPDQVSDEEILNLVDRRFRHPTKISLKASTAMNS